MNKKIIWITQTAVMIALLVVLQAVTKPLGQFVTGSLVNLILIVAALFGGLNCGLTVALVSPFFAYLLGIGTNFIQIVPAIAIGNIVFVMIMHSLTGKALKKRSYIIAGIELILSAAVKFLTLWALIVKLIIPTLGLDDNKAAVLGTTFSWPQLITALIGGALAMAIVPLIQKALKKEQ